MSNEDISGSACEDFTFYIFYIFIFYMRKLRHREVKRLVQGHTASGLAPGLTTTLYISEILLTKKTRGFGIRQTWACQFLPPWPWEN